MEIQTVIIYHDSAQLHAEYTGDSGQTFVQLPYRAASESITVLHDGSFLQYKVRWNSDQDIEIEFVIPTLGREGSERPAVKISWLTDDLQWSAMHKLIQRDSFRFEAIMQALIRSNGNHLRFHNLVLVNKALMSSSFGRRYEMARTMAAPGDLESSSSTDEGTLAVARPRRFLLSSNKVMQTKNEIVTLKMDDYMVEKATLLVDLNRLGKQLPQLALSIRASKKEIPAGKVAVFDRSTELIGSGMMPSIVPGDSSLVELGHSTKLQAVVSAERIPTTPESDTYTMRLTVWVTNKTKESVDITYRRRYNERESDFEPKPTSRGDDGWLWEGRQAGQFLLSFMVHEPKRQ